MPPIEPYQVTKSHINYLFTGSRKTMLTDKCSSPTALIEKHFGTLKDPRALHKIEHLLIDIM